MASRRSCQWRPRRPGSGKGEPGPAKHSPIFAGEHQLAEPLSPAFGATYRGVWVHGRRTAITKSRQEEEKEQILEVLEAGPASKRDLFDGEPTGTQNRALNELKEEYLVIYSPGADGYVSLQQADYCIACATDIPAGSGRCGTTDCLQPQQEVKCRECGEWFLIDPYPLPPRIPEDELPEWHKDPRSWPEDVEQGAELHRRTEDLWSGLDRACPACAAVWEPPEPWPYPLERAQLPVIALTPEKLERLKMELHEEGEFEELEAE